MALEKLHRKALILLQFSLLFICSTRSEPSPVDCTTKVFGQAKRDDQKCTIQFIDRNECSALDFSGDDSLGDVSLKNSQLVFGGMGTYSMSLLNLTFSEITWKRAIFRYKVDAFDVTNYTFCREIQIIGEPQPEAKLFYDTNWLERSPGNQPCTLDVLLENGNKKSHKKMRFIFLPENQLEQKGSNSTWKIFTYLDVSTPGEVILHWQKPSKYSPTSYIITAKSNVQTKIQNLTGSSAAFKLSRNADWYDFRVKPIGNECGTNGCQEGGYRISIESLSAASFFLYLLPLVLIIIAVALFVYIYLPAMRRYQLIGLPEPTVLVIYKSNHKEHSSAVNELCQYLRTKNMKMLLYDQQIPEQQGQDPYRWCLDKMENADIILLVSSPGCCPNRADGVYTNVYSTLEHMMRNNAVKQSGRMFKVLLPYCKENDFPEAACTMYRLPSEMSSFVNSVHKLSNVMQKFVFLCGRKEDSELLKLKKELDKAEHELQKHTVLQSVPMQSLDEVNIEIDLNDHTQFDSKLDLGNVENDFGLKPMVEIKGLKLLGENNDNDQPEPRESRAARPLLDKMDV